MKTAAARQDLLDRRYPQNVEQLNHFVDELRAEHGPTAVPYIDPDCGGVNARVLFLYQDPGPKASGLDRASGFLSIENDDPSAEALCRLLGQAGLSWKACVPWNTVPWYINRVGASYEIEKALPYLHRFRTMLPHLRVVALMGNSAQSGWSRYQRRYPEVKRGLVAIPTLHTSGRGLTRGSRQRKAEGLAQVLDKLRDVRLRAGL